MIHEAFFHLHHPFTRSAKQGAKPLETKEKWIAGGVGVVLGIPLFPLGFLAFYGLSYYFKNRNVKKIEHFDNYDLNGIMSNLKQNIELDTTIKEQEGDHSYREQSKVAEVKEGEHTVTANNDPMLPSDEGAYLSGKEDLTHSGGEKTVKVSEEKEKEHEFDESTFYSAPSKIEDSREFDEGEGKNENITNEAQKLMTGALQSASIYEKEKIFLNWLVNMREEFIKAEPLPMGEQLHEDGLNQKKSIEQVKNKFLKELQAVDFAEPALEPYKTSLLESFNEEVLEGHGFQLGPVNEKTEEIISLLSLRGKHQRKFRDGKFVYE